MNIMVYGDVSYLHHHGHETASDWAAVVKLAKEDEQIKMAKYHIIVVRQYNGSLECYSVN